MAGNLAVLKNKLDQLLAVLVVFLDSTAHEN